MSGTRKLLTIVTAGRLPTVFHDTSVHGILDSHQGSGTESYDVFNANTAFWEALCSPTTVLQARRSLGILGPLKLWAWDQLMPRPLAAAAEDARVALLSLRTYDTFRNPEIYHIAIETIHRFLTDLNTRQDHAHFDLSCGVRLGESTLANLASLVDYCQGSHLHSALIAESLKSFPSAVDEAHFRITSMESFVATLISARILKESRLNLRTVIIDHWYENFTLDAHRQAIESNETIRKWIDTIAWRRGGLPTNDDPSHSRMGIGRPFTPTPVVWLRASDVPCYWGKCLFCAQNAKQRSGTDGFNPTRIAERMTGFVKEGARHFIFSDEAFHPDRLRALALELAARRIHTYWSVRARVDEVFDNDLLSLLKQVGCGEILFGVESFVPRVQNLMGKYNSPIAKDRIISLIERLSRYNITSHLSMMVGFPGETLQEAWETVHGTIEGLRACAGSSHTLNLFSLFPESPLARDPAAVGMRVLPSSDMDRALSFQLTESNAAHRRAIEQDFPKMRQAILDGIDWPHSPHSESRDISNDFYANSAHGIFLKEFALRRLATHGDRS